MRIKYQNSGARFVYLGRFGGAAEICGGSDRLVSLFNWYKIVRQHSSWLPGPRSKSSQPKNYSEGILYRRSTCRGTDPQILRIAL